MLTYSFLNVQASLSGPGGSISLGAGSANAEEGISIEYTEDTDTMMIGADGQGMHSLHAARAGRIVVRLLKTSPVNGKLMDMYNLQRQSSATHGQNTITLNDSVRGDSYTCRQVAFVRAPSNVYAKEGGTIEWEFNAVYIDGKLSAGF